VEFEGNDEHAKLKHRVKLKGAKDPFNYFTIVCTTETEGRE